MTTDFHGFDLPLEELLSLPAGFSDRDMTQPITEGSAPPTQPRSRSF